MKNAITSRQAAHLLNCTTSNISKLCKAKTIRAQLIGRTWFCDSNSVAKYAANRPKRGPKPCKKN